MAKYAYDIAIVGSSMIRSASIEADSIEDAAAVVSTTAQDMLVRGDVEEVEWRLYLWAEEIEAAHDEGQFPPVGLTEKNGFCRLEP